LDEPSLAQNPETAKGVSKMKTQNPRVAVITGASRGIGKASAKRLAAEGYTVAINYNSSRAEAEALAKEISRAKGKAFTVQGDISSVDGIEAFFSNLDQELVEATASSQFDVLICNAGVIRAATVDHTTEADFDALFNLNTKGVFYTIKHALPRMRSGGTILTVGSGLTRFSYPQYAAYAASKGAITTLTQVLAKDLGQKNITVNMVAPGPVDTDLNADWLRNDQARDFIASQTALGRVAEAQDIEGVISFLCGPDSRWVTGQRIEASGGIHL
jgi:3-oxoacyl-[acyl-carrier protein] reductase